MKRIHIALPALALCLALCGQAQASEPAGGDPVLRIVSETAFDGMDASYGEGYVPRVEDGALRLVLPLYTPGQWDIRGRQVLMTLGLGEADESPFALKNYALFVGQSAEARVGSVGLYLLDVRLTLLEGALPGRYPLTVTVSGSTGAGPFSQSFTVYAVLGEERQGKYAAGPRLILAEYSAEDGALDLTVENTSPDQPARDVRLTVRSASGEVTFLGGVYTRALGALEAGARASLSLPYEVAACAEGLSQKVEIAIEYADQYGKEYVKSADIAFPTPARMRLECDPVQVAQTVYAGDSIPVTLKAANFGRDRVYNVVAQVAADGLSPEGRIFLGNLDAGAAKSGETYCFVTGFKGMDADALVNGRLLISYEDVYGKAYEAELGFQTTIRPMVIAAARAETAEEPEKAMRWSLSLSILFALAGLIAFAAALRMRRQRGARYDEAA